MSEKERRSIVLAGGRLVDGTGAEPVADAVIVIDGGKIDQVGPAGQVDVPATAEVIDVAGKTILPGLIDAHVHLFGITSMNQMTWVIDEPHVRTIRASMDAWRCLDAGFTTVRDAGGMLAIYVKRAIEEGTTIGPRIVASGMIISQTAGHGDMHFVPAEWNRRMQMTRLADGVPEVRKAAREQLREGADMLKIFTTGGIMSEKDKPTACQYSMDEIRAFVEEARNAGVRSGTHAQGTQGIKNAVLAGVDNVDHGIYLDDEAIALMVERGTTLVPNTGRPGRHHHPWPRRGCVGVLGAQGRERAGSPHRILQESLRSRRRLRAGHRLSQRSQVTHGGQRRRDVDVREQSGSLAHGSHRLRHAQ